MIQHLLKPIKTYIDYAISKEKYEITDKLLKTHETMKVGEISNHLRYILGFYVNTKKAEEFFKTYTECNTLI
jgi:hypothetical protein